MNAEVSNIQCSNCCNFFQNDDIIYGSIKCGHLYHQKCLNKKFEQNSRICGGQYNCKTVCYPRYCRRVYLSFNSFSWEKIKSDIIKSNQKEFEGSLLQLNNNNNGSRIYAARICLSDTNQKCYYNVEMEKIYLDFECELEYIDKHEYEFLYIGHDNRHQYTWEASDRTDENTYYRNNEKLVSKLIN